jgi:hypothetical protein
MKLAWPETSSALLEQTVHQFREEVWIQEQHS